MSREEVENKLREVDMRLANSTSFKNRNDLKKYKRRLLKELKKCR